MVYDFGSSVTESLCVFRGRETIVQSGYASEESRSSSTRLDWRKFKKDDTRGGLRKEGDENREKDGKRLNRRGKEGDRGEERRYYDFDFA